MIKIISTIVFFLFGARLLYACEPLAPGAPYTPCGVFLREGASLPEKMYFYFSMYPWETMAVLVILPLVTGIIYFSRKK